MIRIESQTRRILQGKTALGINCHPIDVERKKQFASGVLFGERHIPENWSHDRTYVGNEYIFPNW